jgi:hypothetical protein
MKRGIKMVTMKKLVVVFLLSLLLIVIGCSKGVELPIEVTNEIKSKCSHLDYAPDKDLCTYDLAIENQDENFCQVLSRENDKNACIAKIRTDSSFCDNVDNEIEAYYCVINSEPDKADPAFCETLEEIDKDLCISATASEKQDAQVCKKIADEIYKNLCLSEVAKVKQDKAVCDEISEEYNKNQCLKTVAVAKQDGTICSEITAESTLELFGNKKDECFREVALAKEDKNLCQQVENADVKNWCLASFEKKEESCQKIKDATIKLDCLIGVAEETQSVSICENIVSLGKKDKCFRKVALVMNDKDICEKILDVYTKDSCTFDIDYGFID